MASPDNNSQPYTLSMHIVPAGTATPTPSTAGQSAGVPRRRSAGRLCKWEVDQRRIANQKKKDLAAKVLRRSLEKHNKIVPTENNGFQSGLKPECIMTCVKQDQKLIFVVKFHNRKRPELIPNEDLKKHVPRMLISYYAENLRNADIDMMKSQLKKFSSTFQHLGSGHTFGALPFGRSNSCLISLAQDTWSPGPGLGPGPSCGPSLGQSLGLSATTASSSATVTTFCLDWATPTCLRPPMRLGLVVLMAGVSRKRKASQMQL
ncbi:hypothetical protein AWZ03_012826 [Drosophila navojoa]|uniref:Chromo shadow domain-containing protein n=1 Tax=Drosophila navojoa TaxID=7232 RepID=A0A484AXM9_DRONA|nr:hypothetical protein AWZ03_012826 [Drosophila navojoa]